MSPTCYSSVGLVGVQSEWLGHCGHHSGLGDGGGGGGVAHGGVLAGVHVQQGVAGLHQLHDVGADLPVRVGGGGVELLYVGTGWGLGGHGLPGENNYYSSCDSVRALSTQYSVSEFITWLQPLYFTEPLVDTFHISRPGTQCGQFVMNI